MLRTFLQTFLMHENYTVYCTACCMPHCMLFYLQVSPMQKNLRKKIKINSDRYSSKTRDEAYYHVYRTCVCTITSSAAAYRKKMFISNERRAKLSLTWLDATAVV